MDTKEIIFPDADELDFPRQEWICEVYLIPSAETGGLPEITTHSGVGNIGTPMRAWNNRWHSLGVLPGRCVGSSALHCLQRLEDDILSLNAEYLGSEWDGSNLVGKWEESEDDPSGQHLEDAWMQAFDDCESYWDAGDWYGADSCTWTDYAKLMDLDPKIVLSKNWENAVSVGASKLEAEQDEPVRGTEEYLLGLIEQYQDEQEGGSDT